MKYIYHVPSVCFFLSIFSASFVLNADPFVKVGELVDITFNGNVNLKSDTNIFRTKDDAVSDTVLVTSPGFKAKLGKDGSEFDINAGVSYDLVKYQDRKDLDTELLHYNASGAFSGSRLVVNGSFSFDESKSNNNNDVDTDDLTERESTSYNFLTEYKLSPKFSVSLGYNYLETNYVGKYAITSSDLTLTRIPFKVFYELSPKLDLSVGYTRGKVDPELAKSYNTNYYNVGLRGVILPKLSGSFDVGFNDRAGKSRTIGANGSLSWLVNPKLTSIFNFSRDFSASSTSVDTLETNLGAKFNYLYSTQITFSMFSNMAIREYANSNRNDDLITMGISSFYTINSNLQANMGYQRQTNDSTDNRFNYTDNILNIGLTLTY